MNRIEFIHSHYNNLVEDDDMDSITAGFNIGFEADHERTSV